ncbi:hypothetical protein CGRA01v4_13989 [Colletotrichum graminicola]|nr:hypothetical protein CGRA01v4_13989 [Colletotrichum graminicola]
MQQNSFREPDSTTRPLVPLLRLQHTIAWILLSVSGPGREMDYDGFLPQFQHCVGILPVLFIIGAKCRHPAVRREALGILRQQPMREAVWDSLVAAKVVERIIEIEEGGLGDGERAQSMGKIAAWQRIEIFSWVIQVRGRSAARVDMEYSFCEREGVHVESHEMEMADEKSQHV